MDCYIFDIDGTLANNKHRTVHLEGTPKRWDLYNATMADDTVFEHVARVCRDLGTFMPIIYCTGREAVFRGVTETWLKQHRLDHHAGLFMRGEKDYRPDHIIKIELLGEIRAKGFHPTMAFDDRNSVVEAWRANGVPCAQVADGDF